MPRALRRSMLVVLVALLSSSLFAALAGPAWAGKKWRVTILHTNDLHGMMVTHEYQRDFSPFADEPRQLGGLARRATAIEQLRRRIVNPVVVMDTGDFFTRGPWHERWFGEPEVEAMNLMGYDMLCVGNNELKPIWDDPVSKGMMLSLMRRSRFPWLAANLRWGGSPSGEMEGVGPVEGIHPFVVRMLGGVRVGFLGLTTPASAEYPHLTGWVVGDPVEAAKRWVPLARKECDVLIAVTHLGVEEDRRLAAEVAGIDAIVGGHSHTFIPGPRPVMVENPLGREVPIAQAGDLGVVLGKLDLTFERGEGWRLIEAWGKLIPIDESFPEDPAVKALLEPYLAPEAAEAVPAAAAAPAG